MNELPRIIFQLNRDTDDYDEMVAAVVVALTEDSARQWAASVSGGEGPDAWYSLDTVCVRIGVADDNTEFGVVMRNVLRG